METRNSLKKVVEVNYPRPRRWYENTWGEWFFPVSISWRAACCGYLAFAAWVYLLAMPAWCVCICCSILPVMTMGLGFPMLSLWLGLKFLALRRKNPHLRGLGRVRGGIFFSSLYLFLFLLLWCG